MAGRRTFPWKKRAGPRCSVAVAKVFETYDLVQRIADVGGVRARAPLRGVNRLSAHLVRTYPQPTLGFLLRDAMLEFRARNWDRWCRRVVSEMHRLVPFDNADPPPNLFHEIELRVMRDWGLTNCTEEQLTHILATSTRTVHILDPPRAPRTSRYRIYVTAPAVHKALAHTDGLWGVFARRAERAAGRRTPPTPIRYSPAQHNALRKFEHHIGQCGFLEHEVQEMRRVARRVR